MSKHRGAPVFKYIVDVIERERGWGQNSWEREFDTRREAQDFIDYTNSFNKAGPAPDYYIQASETIREVQQ